MYMRGKDWLCMKSLRYIHILQLITTNCILRMYAYASITTVGVHPPQSDRSCPTFTNSSQQIYTIQEIEVD